MKWMMYSMKIKKQTVIQLEIVAICNVKELFKTIGAV